MPNPINKVLIYTDDATGHVKIVHPVRPMRAAIPAATDQVTGATIPATPGEGQPEYIADIRAGVEADGSMLGYTYQGTMPVGALPANRANRAAWRFSNAGGGSITGA